MNLKNYLLLALFGLLLSSCYNDEKVWDALNEQEKRIEALENWQKVVNENINALHALVAENDYITFITPITMNSDTVGYTISFKNQPSVSIYNGKKGEQGDKGDRGETGSTPKISLTQQKDGNWYWTLNGELMKDSKGNAIRANGKDGVDGKPGEDGSSGTSAPVPQLKSGSKLPTNIKDSEGKGIIPNAIYLSVDGGKTWTKVSGQDGEQGDATFKNVKTTDDCVIFTLDNNEEISVPFYSSFMLRFEDSQTATVTTEEPLTIKVLLPKNLKADDHVSLIATITPTNGSIITRATSGWSVNITQTDFNNHFAIVTVTGGPSLKSSDQALLSVILTYENGRQVTTSQIVEFLLTKKLEEAEVGDFYMKDGTVVGKDVTLTDTQKKRCIGIVFWKGNATKKDKTLETDHPGCTHGLVVALNEYTEIEWQIGWIDKFVSVQEWLDINENGKFLSIQSKIGDAPANNIQGYNNTKAIEAYNKANPSYHIDVVKKIEDYRKKVLAPSNSSDWYLPSVKELTLLCSGKDVSIVGDPIRGTDNKKKINKSLQLVDGIVFDRGSYWSSTEYSAGQAFRVGFYACSVGEHSKHNTDYSAVRYVLAF